MAEGCLLMSADERERSHLIRATVEKQRGHRCVQACPVAGRSGRASQAGWASDRSMAGCWSCPWSSVVANSDPRGESARMAACTKRAAV